MSSANRLMKFGIDGLTPAYEAELSQAYHMDETSASTVGSLNASICDGCGESVTAEFWSGS